MSGYPCINPLDAEKFREQYLSNLALDISNMQLNLNANQIYKQTGQSPNQLEDMRTTTEKYADLEGLKVALRSFLSSTGIMSTHIANEVIQEISPAELRFFMQYKDFIMKDFKGRGIPSHVFIVYLRKLRQKISETQGVDYGLQQSTGQAILLSNQQILQGMVNARDLEEVKAYVEQIPDRTAALGGLISEVLKRIAQLEKIIPTQEDLSKMGELNPASRHIIQVLLNEALRDIPSKGDLDNEMSMLQIAIQNGDEQRTREVMRELAVLLESSQVQLEQIQLTRAEVAKASGQQLPEALAVEPLQAEVPTTPPKRHQETRSTVVPESIVTSPQDFPYYHMDKQRAFLKSKGVKLSSKMDKVEINHAFEQWLLREQGGAGGHGLKGTGLIKRKRPIERSTGYEKPKAYTQFGKYLINRHKLDENILMVRRPCGGGINELPTELISNPLVHVLRTLSGGGLPEYEAISELSHCDKMKLHKLVKHTRFEKISVPHPTKSDDQKEMDRFDILKGEIMAGNDNKTLVKEFKVMVMKFIHDGRLPRRQGQEILTDLCAMGY